MDETTINKKFAEQEEILQELLTQTKKTQKTLNWLRIIGVIKIVAILAPIIFAIFYLPPFIKNAIDKYGDAIPGLNIQDIMNP